MYIVCPFDGYPPLMHTYVGRHKRSSYEL